MPHAFLAVKFTPAGGRIRVTCGEEDGVARLDVADTAMASPRHRCQRFSRASAQEVIAAWPQRPADVLVTDLSMPGMDGFGLLPAITRDTEVKAVALSGLARADDRQRAL